MGRTGIHTWGNRVRRQFFGGGAVVVEPRSPAFRQAGSVEPLPPKKSSITFSTWSLFFTFLQCAFLVSYRRVVRAHYVTVGKSDHYSYYGYSKERSGNGDVFGNESNDDWS